MVNRIIVESKNDQVFFQTLIYKYNIEDTAVDEPINEFVLLGGIDSTADSPTKLITKLKDLKTEILKTGIEKIGIIIDIDDKTEGERMLMINNAIREAFNEVPNIPLISNINTPININYEGETLSILCYFTNVNQNGELEILLRSIATKEAPHADCLQSWRDCLKAKGKEITDKEFDKFWIANYLRFDTCTNREKRRAEKKCSMGGEGFEYIMTNKAEIFDLDSQHLDDIKTFLTIFN
ncbi:MAG: hypothetical protein N4A74_25850 [Carboxylicivirga sp.]|jgi:hypothetical protein|nr:hypothetical protein [Carboxylicivirga sp.]